MPSHEAIADVFEVFSLAGLQGGPQPGLHTERMIEVWARVLRVLSDDDVRVRADQLLARTTNRWWPVPGELMQMPGNGGGPVVLSEEVRKRMQKRADEIAGELWAEVVLPLARRGAGMPEGPMCEDEAEEEAVREGLRAIGGLRTVGALETDSRGMFEKRALFLGSASAVLRGRWGKRVRVVGGSGN